MIKPRLACLSPAQDGRRPFYRDDLVTLYNADATHLPFVAPGSVDLTITSPPYNLDVAYADYLNAFRAAGWAYQTTIVWNEQNISRRTAWGSWRKPSAPFVTAPVEMIAVFYKERWQRSDEGRTWKIAAKDFMDWTLGTWTFPGANPKRVGHPAPFPEELPRRLILLYSYVEDTILEPFAGSGTTCRVAKALGRRSIGVEIDAGYCALAAARCREAGR